MFVAMGLGNDPQLIRPLLGPAGNVLGTLLQVNAAGGWRVVADIAAYEAAVDPNGGLIDSNLYRRARGGRVAAGRGRGSECVASCRGRRDDHRRARRILHRGQAEVPIQFRPPLRSAPTVRTTSASQLGCRSPQERLVSTAWSKAWSQR